MTGYLLDDALREKLNDAAVVVIPTIMEETGRASPSWNKWIRGKPVIVSDLGGGLAEVAGDAGLKFPPGNAPALAACLRQLVDDPALLRDLGIRAKNRAVAVFSLDRMIDEHFCIFEKLAAEANQ